MKRSRNAGPKRLASQEAPAAAAPILPTEDVNPQEQLDQLASALAVLHQAQDSHTAACNELAKLRPSAKQFDSAVNTVELTVRALISARRAYLKCARTI